MPLTVIIQSSIIHGAFPDVWKQAKICPVPKTGKLTDVKLFRPISVLCSFSKVLEMYIYEIVFNRFQSIVSPHQHGFMPKRSTITNLVNFTQIANETLIAGDQLDVFCADFSKAFDRVDTKILLHKLNDLGLSVQIMKLLNSYLVNRKNIVYFGGCLSEPFTSTSGVPQGSNLGPLLFLVFINDLAQYSSCYFDLFADDSKYYKKVRNKNDCEFLQRNIECLIYWCEDNKLLLNVDKCCILTISRKKNPIVFNYNMFGKTLERCTSARILGVNFDSRLSFCLHINDIISEAWRTLGFIIRISKNFFNLKAIKLLYNTFVRPKLEYASIVWSPIQLGQSVRLERVQRKFLKFLVWKKTGMYPLRGTDDHVLCIECEYHTLYERRISAEFSFATKLFNNLVHCPQLLTMFKFKGPVLGLRNHTPIYVPIARNNLAQAVPVYRILETVNRFCDLDPSLDPLSCPNGYLTASLCNLAAKWR